MILERRRAAVAVLLSLSLLALGACDKNEPDDDAPVNSEIRDDYESTEESKAPETETPADTEAPVISGVVDIVTELGCGVSYREGVSVTDNVDEEPTLTVDSSSVDLSTPGTYKVVYTATDKSGNKTTVTVNVTVTEATSTEPDDPNAVTDAMLKSVTDKILSSIITDETDPYGMAKAIYDYVNQNVTYVSTSDKSDWKRGAYLALTEGKGDCYNYWAASKALLTAVGIDNLDLERVGGDSRHYWNLVNVGDGWYHFDTCWHPKGHSLYSFMLTDAEVEAYTEKLQNELNWANYYTYDRDSCPVTVE